MNQGYTSNQNIAEPTRSSPPTSRPRRLNDNKNATVLLPGSPGQVGPPRYVLGPAGMTGTAVKSASAQLNNGQWAVNLNLTGAGATPVGHPGRQQFHAIIGIDLDGQVISAPITQPTQSLVHLVRNGQVQISGSFTEDQAKTLATDFTYGALPVKLDRLTVQTVSPSLGKSSLQAGLISGLAGLALVMLYIIFYYRLLGLVVLAGLAVTGALLWAIIAFMGESLQHHHQPGRGHRHHRVHRDHRRLVHRLLRTVEGRDAERRTIRTSVDRGFASAFRTVLAADAVSLLARSILYVISVGDVEGFALFLGISTVLDIVITYFFTRPFVILLGQSRGGERGQRHEHGQWPGRDRGSGHASGRRNGGIPGTYEATRARATRAR